MTLYVCYISLIVLIAYINNIFYNPRYKYLGLKLITIITILFSSIRYSVGVDYTIYYNIIMENKISAILRTEPLNQLIFFISTHLKSPLFCFTTYALITYTFIYHACKNNTKSPYLAILVYISTFYLESLGFIRQAVAMAIGLYAFKFVQEKNIKKYIFYIILSMLFHLSAVLLFAVYIIYWRIKFKYIIIACISILALKNILFLIITKLNFYAGYLDKEITGGSKIRYLYPIFLISLAMLKNFKLDDECKRLYKICFIALPFPFIFSPHVGMRIGNYFFYFMCYLIPTFLQKEKIEIKILTSMYLIAIFFIYIIISDDYLPYQFYWEK